MAQLQSWSLEFHFFWVARRPEILKRNNSE